MTRLALVLVFALGCGDSTAPMLPGESDDVRKDERRGANSPCGGTSDYDGNGTADYLWTYAYDHLGRSIEDRGRAIGGETDDVDSYLWDHVDHLMSYVATVSGQQVWKLESTYDTLGNELDSTVTDAYDAQAITVDRVVNHDFDDHGRPAFAIQSYTGLPDLKMTFTYDELGRMIEREDDDGNDGSIDGRATVVYDEAERTTTTTTSRTDGWHSLRKRTYNEALHTISTHTERFTSNGVRTTTDITYVWEGDREISWTYAYNGTLTSSTRFFYSCAPR